MKVKLILIFLLVLVNSTSWAQNDRKRQPDSIKLDGIPAPIGFVSDFEKVFSAQQVDTLTAILKDFEQQTSIQIAIVTIDTSLVSKVQFENFVLDLANKWGVGQKDKNNGVVIGFSTAHRKIRIANGYGIEKLISDRETNNLMKEKFLVYFKNNEYYKGTIIGLNALIDLLNLKLRKQ